MSMKLWKKLAAAIAAGAVCLGCAGMSGFSGVLQNVQPVLSASAATGTYESLTYSVSSSGTVTITDCDTAVTAVEIPAEIDGCPVTSIKDAVFRGCSKLTDITIPESVTYIGKEAFSFTPWLKARQAENPLVIVNHIVVDGRTCTGDVVIPDGVTDIANYAFSSDFGLVTACSTQMTSVTIPDSVTRIGSSAFSGCKGLRRVKLSKNITAIEVAAFYQCDSLPEIVLPEGLTTIRSNAFSSCTRLTGLRLPDSLTKMENWAFASCANLTRITIPDSVTSMGQSIFSECDGLTIRGYAGSFAQKYAENYDIPFADLNSTNTLLGDVDENGTLDSTDIFYAMYYVANIAVGNAGELTPQQIAAADIDCDGAVDASDIFYLMYYVALHGAGIRQTWSELLAK